MIHINTTFIHIYALRGLINVQTSANDEYFIVNSIPSASTQLNITEL